MNEAKTMEYITTMMTRLLEADGPLTGTELSKGLIPARQIAFRERQALAEAFGAMRRAGMIEDTSKTDVSRWALTYRGKLAARVLAEEVAA